MSIVTGVGRVEELRTVVDVLESNGFTVTTLVEPTVDASSPANVGVFGVSTDSGDDIPAADLDPLLQQLRDREPPLCPMLFASDRQARAIKWDHDGDECEAIVGQRMRWRAYPKRNSTRYGPWHHGRTVWQIADGPTTWRVQLSIVERRDVWTDFLMCGDSAQVEWF